MKSRKGTFTIEYAILMTVIILALLAIFNYTKRAICGRWREAADSFSSGRQYNGGWER